MVAIMMTMTTMTIGDDEENDDEVVDMKQNIERRKKNSTSAGRCYSQRTSKHLVYCSFVTWGYANRRKPQTR